MNTTTHSREMIRQTLALNLRLAVEAIESISTESVLLMAEDVAASFRAGRMFFAFGNGGSAAIAQHLCAEFVGHFRRERPPLPALALTADSVLVTALSNDYGYEQALPRIVRGIVKPGDVVLGMSTSGTSENVVRALKDAAYKGAVTWAWVGGSLLCPVSDAAQHKVGVACSDTAHIQEAHLVMAHLLAGAVDDILASG